MNPYLVLGVPQNATDEQIRRAYLDAVKLATPESHPEQFKAIAQAYDQVKDEPSRHQYELFNKKGTGDTPLEVFLAHLRISPRPHPLSLEAMRDFLRSCSKT